MSNGLVLVSFFLLLVIHCLSLLGFTQRAWRSAHGGIQDRIAWSWSPLMRALSFIVLFWLAMALEEHDSLTGNGMGGGGI